jgi:hypothetical protein
MVLGKETTGSDAETDVQPVHSPDILIPVHPDIAIVSPVIDLPTIPKSKSTENDIFYKYFLFFFSYCFILNQHHI